MGDIMGDLNKRRGRILGVNPDPKDFGYTVVDGKKVRFAKKTGNVLDS